jgi:hypothetical protein
VGVIANVLVDPMATVGRRLGARIRRSRRRRCRGCDDDLLAEYFTRFLPHVRTMMSVPRPAGKGRSNVSAGSVPGLRVQRGRGQQQRACAE